MDVCHDPFDFFADLVTLFAGFTNSFANFSSFFKGDGFFSVGLVSKISCAFGIFVTKVAASFVDCLPSFTIVSFPSVELAIFMSLKGF